MGQSFTFSKSSITDDVRVDNAAVSSDRSDSISTSSEKKQRERWSRALSKLGAATSEGDSQPLQSLAAPAGTTDVPYKQLHEEEHVRTSHAISAAPAAGQESEDQVGTPEGEEDDRTF